jgi:hypothetical protein
MCQIAQDVGIYSRPMHQNQNLKIQWETYFMFCFYFGLQSLPSSVKVLTLYAQFLSKSFVSVQSIKNYLNVFTELGTKLLFLLI